jgi:GNAT superfamily N-acetyltransferase/ABC-type transport system involved in cytochrome c biogenesis ATPase subunit
MNQELTMPDTWMALQRETEPLTSTVQVSNQARAALQNFDYKTDGHTAFYPYQMPELPQNFGIGVIVGASGTGKSTLLNYFGSASAHVWDNRAIVDHFENADAAAGRLFAVGLTSVPTWMKPYRVLSNGEKFRADLAVSLEDNAVIDEYTSVVDRNIAIAASKSLNNYVNQQKLKGIVIATCHRDVLPYLQPDWIIDTDAGMFAIEPKECLRRDTMVVEVYEVKPTMWELYAEHHYLTADLSPFARCYAAIVSGSPAGFHAVISYPSGTVTNAFREHRLVTHPDYQGLGIGPKLSDFIAAGYVRDGKRFFGKTAHPRLGEYRERSSDWKPTSKNKKFRTDVASGANRPERFVSWKLNPLRFTYSHEFIGGSKNE